MKQTRIGRNHFRVAIFGSARIRKNDWEYELVKQLGSLLAQENISIITGGGPGLMNAASEGHHAGRKGNNVHALGFTVSLSEKYPLSFHLDINRDFKRFSDRLDMFMRYSNVVVVAPGGVGTLLEFFYTWQLIQVKHTCEIPVILLGKSWKGLLNWIKKYPLKKNLLNKDDLKYIYIVDTNAEALEIIRKSKEIYEQGRHVCRNLEKYR